MTAATLNAQSAHSYLRESRERFSNLDLAAAAYSAGPGRYQRLAHKPASAAG
jgi:soluble lytic murein transglycosylase-like protein